MKTKANHPFIYFFIEPNVVFVYNIKTQNYLTASELVSVAEWETFELNHEDEFARFDHEESKPLEGRVYLMKQDDRNIMLKEINKQIQKHRNLSNINKELSKSFHIVSSESAAGSLKVGLDQPKNVIAFPDLFSIGPMWKLEEKVGQTFRYEWLFENINSSENDDEYENKFTNALLEIEGIPDQVPIYIWYANNADEQSGVHFIVHLLRDRVNEVFLLHSTDLYNTYISRKDDAQSVFHTSQIRPKNLKSIFERFKPLIPLSTKDRIQMQRKWRTLGQSKEILRLWCNEDLISVPEDHYDPLIVNTLKQLHNEQVNKDFIKAGRVIGEIVIQMDGMISDFFLEYRIRHLIYSGVFELKGIPKSMNHYSVKLRS